MKDKIKNYLKFYEEYNKFQALSEKHIEFKMNEYTLQYSLPEKLLKSKNKDFLYTIDNISLQQGFLYIEFDYQLKTQLSKEFPLPKTTKSIEDTYYKILKECNSNDPYYRYQFLINKKIIEDPDKFELSLVDLEINYLNEKGEDILHYYPLYSIDLTPFKYNMYRANYNNSKFIIKISMNSAEHILVNQFLIDYFFSLKLRETDLHLNYLCNGTPSNIFEFNKLIETHLESHKIQEINISTTTTKGLFLIFESNTEFPPITFNKFIIEDNESLLIEEYLEADDRIKKDFKFTRYIGAYTKDYSLGKGQSIVLSAIQDGHTLIPVVGAPGTGKTTMFKSVLAQSVVKQALDHIKYGKFNNNLNIMTSTANKAVDGVFQDIKEINPYAGSFYLLTSEKAKNKEFYNQLKAFNINEYIKWLEEIVRTYSNIDLNLNTVKNEILKISNYIEYVSANFDHIKNIINIYNSYKYEPGKSIQDKINLLKKIFKGRDISVLINILDSEEFKFLENQDNKYFTNMIIDKIINIFTKDIEKKQQLISNILNIENEYTLESLKEIVKTFSNLREDLKEIIKYKDFQNVKNKYDKIQELLSFNIDIKEDSIIDLFIKNKDFFFKNYILFVYSQLYLAYIVKNNLNEFENSIEKVDHIRGGQKTKLSPKRLSKKELSLFSMIFPLACSSTKNISLKESKENKNFRLLLDFNLSIVDEAGMIPAGDLLHILGKSKKSLIVGDPKQLEPISSIPEVMKNLIYSKFKIEKEFYEKYSSDKVSSYHRAAGSQNGDINIIGNGILLDEHRRCIKPIAELFKIVADYPEDLKILTPGMSKEYINKLNKYNNGKHLEWHEIEGRGTIKNTNIEEINKIEILLKDLNSAGYDLKKDIGIITPYSNQSRLLIEKFGTILNHSKEVKKIGTVHSFQGAEFKVILFSSVLSKDSENLSFVVDNIPLLNVAISRAKDLYIHVGDLNKLKGSSRLMDKYINGFNS